MKVGDKVFVEVEVIGLGKSHFEDTRGNYFNIKEAITQLPIQEGRWMMVSDDKKVSDCLKDWVKRFVIGKFDNNFIAIQRADSEESLKDAGTATTPWKYAKEIPTKRKLTMQEIAEKFNEDVDNIEICTE